MKHFSTVLLSLLLLATGGAWSRAAEEPSDKRPTREEMEKRREELKKLSPEERDAKLKELRDKFGWPPREEPDKRRESPSKITSEERESKRKELKGRLEKRIAELRARQTNSVNAAEDARELERCEQILKRFEQNSLPVASPK